MKSSDETDETPRYENVDNDTGKVNKSVEYCNVQCPYPDPIKVSHTRPISSVVPQDIPDVVPPNPDCQESRKISGVEQVIINDDIYYCPLDDPKSSPGNSDDEDIYKNNQ